ncbi:MAG: HEAT repeat domain-containing protein [Verrucomicrobia bacterium]|nr:HEAT repeat domain-containing protein [Verrucomicrobiota bacterium]
MSKMQSGAEWRFRFLAGLPFTTGPTLQIGTTSSLLNALSDGDENTRMCAAVALGQIGACSDPVIRFLSSSAEDRGSSVRWAAVTALGMLGSNARAALAIVQERLADDDPQVRQAAAAALAQIAPESESHSVLRDR